MTSVSVAVSSTESKQDYSRITIGRKLGPSASAELTRVYGSPGMSTSERAREISKWRRLWCAVELRDARTAAKVSMTFRNTEKRADATNVASLILRPVVRRRLGQVSSCVLKKLKHDPPLTNQVMTSCADVHQSSRAVLIEKICAVLRAHATGGIDAARIEFARIRAADQSIVLVSILAPDYATHTPEQIHADLKVLGWTRTVAIDRIEFVMALLQSRNNSCINGGGR